MMKNMKLVAVGQGGVGKTSMLISYTENRFPYDYCPTVFDNYSSQIQIEDEPICLNLWDTGGGEEYWRLRPLSYPETDVFLLIFSVVSQMSFDQIETLWKPELEHHCPTGKILLCGSKIDLREDEETLQNLKKENKKPISSQEAILLAIRIKAYSYVECSALTQKGLKQVFEEAIRMTFYLPLNDKDEKKTGCILQ